MADAFAQSDLDLVVTAMNDLAWHYAVLNVGPEVMAPQFAYEEPEDLTQAAELDTKLYGLGVRFTARHFENKHSLAEDEFTVVGSGQTEPTDQAELDFAAPESDDNPDEDYQLAISTAVKEYAPETAKVGEKLFRQVLGKIDGAESFEDLERGLGELLGHQTDPDDFVNLLSDLMVTANLMGRFTEDQKRQNDDA